LARAAIFFPAIFFFVAGLAFDAAMALPFAGRGAALRRAVGALLLADFLAFRLLIVPP
jgi:hypothetical protein